MCSVVLSFVVSVFGVVCGYPRHASVQVEGALLCGEFDLPCRLCQLVAGASDDFSSSAGKRETNNNNKAKKKKTKFFNFSWLESVGFDFISHDTTV